jgi:molybdopterin synthase sulfur carrier subunit
VQHDAGGLSESQAPGMMAEGFQRIELKQEKGEETMAVTIEIPTAFRRFTDGEPRVASGAATVSEALNDLTARFPALSRHVRDEQGQIRQFLNVYLNDEDIRFLSGEGSTLKDGDKLLLVPSIAGG